MHAICCGVKVWESCGGTINSRSDSSPIAASSSGGDGTWSSFSGGGNNRRCRC